jgi:AcrR family transcriptional regulator
MGRPANTDPAETRARIREGAAALFAELGLAGASMRAVAARAGVTIGTVHHHFGDKEGLYRACVEAMYDELALLRGELTEIPAAGGTLGDGVAEAVRRSFRFCCAHREAVRLATRDAVDRGEMDPKRRATLLLPALAEVAPMLATLTGKEPGEMRLVLRSVTFLAVRYAITAPAELAAVVGRPTPRTRADRAALEARIEAHLVVVARALLGLPEDP